MNEINWKIINSNISEARSQLQDIEKRIAKGNSLDEDELSIDLQHAYHHLNFAWNARYISTKRFANLTDEDFAKWGKYPIDIEDEDLR